MLGWIEGPAFFSNAVLIFRYCPLVRNVSPLVGADLPTKRFAMPRP